MDEIFHERSHAGPLPVDKPRRGGGVLEWCIKAQDNIRRTRPIAGKGLRANATPNGIILTAPAPVVTPTAFIQSGPPTVEDGVGYVDMYNGIVIWGDDYFRIDPGAELGSTTTVELTAGTNHVYANLPWGDTLTFETQATWPVNPTVSNYKVHLATYEVNLTAHRPVASRTFIAWTGGDIHIPSAYAP